MVPQTRLECLSRLPVPPQLHAAFRYEIHTSRTPRVRWQVDEPVGRMWLIGLQERGGVVTVVRLPVCVVERDFYREIILAPDRETVLGDAWRRSGSRTGRRPRG